MFISVNDKILNIKRVTTIEIDRDTPTEINYLFNDGGYIKQKFKTNNDALNKFNAIAENTMLIETNDKRLINSMYIRNVEKSLINPKKLVYELYGGAPVKESYKNESAVDSALSAIKTKLETIDFGGNSGETVDLTPYLKTEDAEKTYVKVNDMGMFQNALNEELLRIEGRIPEDMDIYATREWVEQEISARHDIL